MEEERGERSWMAWETRRIGVISLRRGGGADGRRGPEVRWEAYLRMRSRLRRGWKEGEGRRASLSLRSRLKSFGGGFERLGGKGLKECARVGRRGDTRENRERGCGSREKRGGKEGVSVKESELTFSFEVAPSFPFYSGL